MNGTLATSARCKQLRKRVIAATPSIIPSSMQYRSRWRRSRTCCRNGHRFLVFSFLDQLGELRRTRHIRPFPIIRKLPIAA